MRDQAEPFLLEQIKKLEAERDELRKELFLASERLDAAATSIDDWGQYAGEYFTNKHGLSYEVALYKSYATQARRAIAGKDGKS